MQDHPRISIDPAVMVGKPCIRGTRITVEHVINLMGEGWTPDDLLRNYPHLTHEDILACLRYAGDVMRDERVYPLPAAE
ncbi:MAG: DUF433 domain-containing protein [Dichotomicrobium sp.]